MAKSVFSLEVDEWLKENINKYETWFSLLDGLNKEFNAEFCRTTLLNHCKDKGIKRNPNKINNYRFYSEEQEEWIRNNINNYTTIKSLCDDFNIEFNMKRTPSNICDKIKNMNVHSDCYKKQFKFTAEMDEWLKNNYNNYYNCDLVKEFNKKFGVSLYKKQLAGHCRRKLKIQKEDKNFFNKNRAEIGHEYENNGVLYIKVQDNRCSTNKEPNLRRLNYRRKLHVLYEEYYGVKVDDDKQIVIQIDKDKTNFSKENLILIDKEAFWKYNGKNYQFENWKLNKIAILNSQLEVIVDNERKEVVPNGEL